MTILYTRGATISLTLSQANSYTAIRYSETDSTTPVHLILTDASSYNLFAQLGTQPALIDMALATAIGTGAGNDQVNGGAGDQFFSLGDGDDTVYGLGGNDQIISAAGNDLAYGGKGDDRLDDLDGTNQFYGGDGADFLNFGYEVGTLAGTSSAYGGTGNDTLWVSQDYASTDHLFGGEGTDQLSFTYTPHFSHGFLARPNTDIELFIGELRGSDDGNVFDFSAARTSTLGIIGGAGNDLIHFGQGTGWAAGGGGNDTIYAATGGSRLEGGAGRDVLYGSGGNDSFNLTATDLLQDKVFGGGGQDQLDLQGDGAVLGGLAYGTLGTWAGITVHGRFNGNAKDNVFDLSATQDINSGVDIFAGAGNDTLVAPQHWETPRTLAALYGGDGYDVLRGSALRDVLDGGKGADTMTGGAGADIYLVDNAHDVVIEGPGAGKDRIKVSATEFAAVVNVEEYWLIGTGGVTLTGDATADHYLLASGSGNDEVFMGGGNDVMDAGTRISASLVVHGGDGNDVIQVDKATATLTGDNGDDVIHGGSLGNEIYGGAGNDYLEGGAGNDFLYGGAGTDVFIGGLGDDFYDMTTGEGFLAGTDGEDFNGGHDTLRADFLNSTLLGGIEDFISSAHQAIKISGNALANRIEATGFADSISGGANDTLVGGAGNDSYFVTGDGAKIIETAGGGRDVLTVQATSFDLPLYVEETRFSPANFDGVHLAKVTGNDQANLIILTGNGASVDGGNGNDTLVIDTWSAQPDWNLFTGGGGADTFVLSTTGIDVFGPSITDFTHGVDQIQMDAITFGVAVGTLDPAEFFLAKSGLKTGFYYDQPSGSLTFAVRLGPAMQVYHLATFSNHVALSVDDFWFF